MARFLGVPFRPSLLLGIALACLTMTEARALTLKVGDIFVANFGGGNILKVDPKTGAQQNWGAVTQPTDVSPSSDGFIYITGLNNVVSKLCIATGDLTPLSSGGLLNQPYGLVQGPSGDLFVTSFANSLVVQVDHNTGAQTLVASGGLLSGPLGIAFNAAGKLVVGNYNTSSILEINPTNGAQLVLVSGHGLNHPHHLVLNPSGVIFIGNDVLNGGNLIQKFTPGSTTVSNVASAGSLKSPRGIAIEGTGKLVSAQFDDKHIVRVDPVSGALSGISSKGLLNQPYGVAIYNFPSLPPEACFPTLSIAVNGPSLIVSWTTNSLGYTLQSTPDISMPGLWANVTNAVQVVGSSYAVTLSPASDVSFFRLRK